MSYGSPPTPVPSDTIAITALVLAIAPAGFTWLIAIALAVLALVQIRRGRASGTAMAVGALVVSFAWIALTAVTVPAFTDWLSKHDVHQVKDQDADHDDARAAGSGTIWVEMVRTGDCLVELPQGEVIDELVITPCAEPHLGEVFRVFPIDAPPNPTQEGIDRLADVGCDKGLEKFVGISAEESDLYVELIDPALDDLAWNSDVICYAFTPEGLTTGSLKGTRR